MLNHTFDTLVQGAQSQTDNQINNKYLIPPQFPKSLKESLIPV